MIADICAFTGHWPFHYMRQGKLSELQKVFDKNNVKRALISFLDSVFYRDPYEGDALISTRVIEAGHLFCATANPTLVGALQDLSDEKNSLHASAVRLYPSWHGYPCDSPDVVNFVSKAGRIGLPVIITARTDDLRIDYLFKQTVVSCASALVLAQKCPETKILLSGFSVADVIKNAVLIENLKNVFIDISRFNHYLFNVEKVLSVVSVQKIIFGSAAPFQTFSAMADNVRVDLQDEHIKRIILWDNFNRFFAIS